VQLREMMVGVRGCPVGTVLDENEGMDNQAIGHKKTAGTFVPAVWHVRL